MPQWARHIGDIVSAFIVGLVVGIAVSFLLVLAINLVLLYLLGFQLAAILGGSGVVAILTGFPLLCGIVSVVFRRFFMRFHTPEPEYFGDLTPLHLCPECLYDLRGIRFETCPECGRPIPPEQRDHLKTLSIEHA